MDEAFPSAVLDGSINHNQEKDCYGDLGENLNELERLLAEKTDQIDPSVEEENQVGETLGKSSVSEGSEDEERVPGLEDLESNLDELKELMVTDNAHLDGQKMDTRTLGHANLDGHQIQDGQ